MKPISAAFPLLALFSVACAACGGAPFTALETLALEDAGAALGATGATGTTPDDAGAGPAQRIDSGAGPAQRFDAALDAPQAPPGDADSTDAADAAVGAQDAGNAAPDSGPPSLATATAACAAYAASVGEGSSDCISDSQACGGATTGQDVICAYEASACQRCWGYLGSVAGDVVTCGACAPIGTF